jgi:phosphoketolase
MTSISSAVDTGRASLRHLLTSGDRRQEHNGYSHQGPGFINNRDRHPRGMTVAHAYRSGADADALTGWTWMS